MNHDFKTTRDYLGNVYSESQNIIRMADTKANIILVLIGVILSIFFNILIKTQESITWTVYIILIPFIISGFFAFITLIPRKTKTNKSDSIIYFKEIQNANLQKIKKSIENQDYIINDYLSNIQQIGKIIDKKFTYLRYSYIFFALAVMIKLIVELILWVKF